MYCLSLFRLYNQIPETKWWRSISVERKLGDPGSSCQQDLVSGDCLKPDPWRAVSAHDLTWQKGRGSFLGSHFVSALVSSLNDLTTSQRPHLLISITSGVRISIHEFWGSRRHSDHSIHCYHFCFKEAKISFIYRLCALYFLCIDSDFFLVSFSFCLRIAL